MFGTNQQLLDALHGDDKEERKRAENILKTLGAYYTEDEDLSVEEIARHHARALRERRISTGGPRRNDNEI